MQNPEHSDPVRSSCTWAVGSPEATLHTSSLLGKRHSFLVRGLRWLHRRRCRAALPATTLATHVYGDRQTVLLPCTSSAGATQLHNAAQSPFEARICAEMLGARGSSTAANCGLLSMRAQHDPVCGRGPFRRSATRPMFWNLQTRAAMGRQWAPFSVVEVVRFVGAPASGAYDLALLADDALSQQHGCRRGRCTLTVP